MESLSVDHDLTHPLLARQDNLGDWALITTSVTLTMVVVSWLVETLSGADSPRENQMSGSNFRRDGLDNPMKVNSGLLTWDRVEQMCEDSDAVIGYKSGFNSLEIEWWDGKIEEFPSPYAAVNAIRAMEQC